MIENDSLMASRSHTNLDNTENNIDNNENNESDSDNEIGNLNVPLKKKSTKSNQNDKGSNNKVNTKSEMAQPNSDQKTEREETMKAIKFFIIALFISIALLAINIGLGVFIWIYKGSFFGQIFFIIGIFTLCVVIFNIVSVFLFRQKFGKFVQNSFNSNNDIDILKEGDSYDELQKSTESSLMNLGMFLLLFTIVLYFVFGIGSFSFHSTVKSEVDSYANDRTQWIHIFNNYTYSKILSYLTSFIISFGVLSLLTIAAMSYLFYLSFRVLGYFQIYEKIVQFISMLFLMVGIVFFYLTIYMSWFKNLALIEEGFIQWLPVALILSSVTVIIISLFGYVGAKNKNKTWLVGTCIATALFTSMFVVFSFCAAISAKSLEKFSDNKCPMFIDYFNQKYIDDTLSCDKYIQTAKTIEELNCPKERIVTYWEYEIDKELSQSKTFMYGCINVSCCYKIYNFLQSFNNYITLICFVIVIFGLILIGTSVFLINLIQRQAVKGTNENRSQYFIYIFVGVIAIVFIVLLARMHMPKYSPSFSNKFNDTVLNNNLLELKFNPYSVLKANKTLTSIVYSDSIKELMEKNIIMENYTLCDDEDSGCVILTYSADITSDNYKISVDENLLRSGGYKVKYDESNAGHVTLKGDAEISTKLFEMISFTKDNINPKICEMKPIKAHIKISAISTSSYVPKKNNTSKRNKTSSFLQKKITTKTKEITYNEKIVSISTQPETNYDIYTIDMMKVDPDTLYTIIEGDYDFSLISKNTQTVRGTVSSISQEGKIVPASKIDITFSYVNFPNCPSVTVSTDINGEFTSEAFPVMKNDVKNELKISYGDSLSKTVLLGGIGKTSVITLPNIILQSDINVDNILSFNSYVIDAITTKPIYNAKIIAFEGDVYFPNSNVNNSKFYYDSMNSDKIAMSTTSDHTGKFTFKKNYLNKAQYTFLLDKEGYYKSLYSYINTNESNVKSIALTPIVEKENEYRVVLEWPNVPYDMNLFVYFKSSDRDQCEVFFGNKKCQHVSMDNDNYSNGTQGAQSITIEEFGNYTYTFAIKKFVVNDDPVKRNETKAPGAENEAPKKVETEFKREKMNSTSKEKIKESEATVKIYTKGYRREIYEVKVEEGDLKSEGEWWVAFCLDGRKGISSIKTINKFYKEEPTYKLCEELYEKE